MLIVVPTIDAADELYGKLGTTFKQCKVLHSGDNSKELMLKYRDDPSVLTDIDVLIITAARLIIDPYELFIRFKGAYREYVLIDEMINFYPPRFAMTREIMDIVTYVDRKRTHKRIKGRELVVGSTTYYQHTYRTIEEMEAAYNSSRYFFTGSSNGIDREKARVIFKHIIKNGLDEPFQNRTVDIAKLLPVVLFDGTADILFKNDPRLLPITGMRYRSDITFSQFPITIRRKNGKDWDTSGLDYDVQTLKDIMSNNPGKTLIVTWKTIEKFPTHFKDADKLESLSPTKYELPDILRKKLIEAGVKADTFEVIYRGSGEDRGSNRFRDFTNIIFLGEWRIPDDIVYDINSMFGCRCSFDDYKLSLMVQTICRTRIRQHNGEPIRVFFSDDISYNLMYDVQEYFINNSEPKCAISGVLVPCKVYKRPEKKNLFGLATIFSYDPKIRDAVINGTPYSFQITLDRLFTLIPKDRKAKSRYDLLIKFLKERDIGMTIT